MNEITKSFIMDTGAQFNGPMKVYASPILPQSYIKAIAIFISILGFIIFVVHLYIVRAQ